MELSLNCFTMIRLITLAFVLLSSATAALSQYTISVAEHATDDDGSCSFADAGYDCDGNCLIDSDGDEICDQDEVTGCQDEAACNYDINATDAGYCAYADAGYDCEGNCVSDADGDGVCDEFEVAGCTDSRDVFYDLPSGLYILIYGNETKLLMKE